MKLIDAPGVYDMPEAAYHADPVITPSLSSSIGKDLVHKSPRHAWTKHPRLNPDHEPIEKTIFDLGKTAHSLMLGDPREFEVIQADDWRSGEAKKRREIARAEGKTPLLAHQWAEVHEMIKAARLQLTQHEVAPHAFVNGEPEKTLIWREGNVWCRARLDWLPKKGRLFFDYKSTGDSAKPETWARTCYSLGFDFQCAFYRRGIKALLGIKDPVFEFVVQETSAPYALSVVGIPPSAIDMADRMVDEALQWWDWCLTTDKWPGYPSVTIYQEPPPWHESRWLDHEERNELMKSNGDDLAKFKQMIDWQAPLPTQG